MIRRATAAVLLSIAAVAVAGDAAAAPRLTPAQLVEGFCGAWNASESAERDRLLKRVFAPNGVYLDPTPTYAAGRAALKRAIVSFHRDYPGARFRCSAPQAHHRAMRVSWLLLGRDGKVQAQGMDFYELTPTGLIERVTGFFGAPPPIKP